jgi:hypothetical protein
MLGEMLSIAIGVFFVYLLLSLICSTVVEGLSKIFALRSRNLEKWISSLLNSPRGEGLTARLYSHPLIDALPKEALSGRPSCIPPDTFALALADVIVGDGAEKMPQAPGDLIETVRKLECDNRTKRALGTLLSGASDLKEALARMADWFDKPMDMVRAAYANLVGTVVFFVAVAVCVALNLDTIMIGRALWNQCQLRAEVEAAAARFTERWESEDIEEASRDVAVLAVAASELAETGIPLGWSREPDDLRSLPSGFQGWLLKIMGLGATVVAASLGAPFWFDLLRRLIGLRHGRAG